MIVVNAKTMRHIAGAAEAKLPPKGRPFLHAYPVISNPLRALPVTDGSHAPVTTIASPVAAHTTKVSMNTPSMDTSPWRAGSRVFAAAAAIGAEPSPASFENTPRPTPARTTSPRVSPRIAPLAAEGSKALTAIVLRAAGIRSRFAIRMMSVRIRYAPAITGTTAPQTFVIRLEPPISTRAARAAVITPEITAAGERPHAPAQRAPFSVRGLSASIPSTAEAMLPDWVSVPIPKSPAAAPDKAKALLSHMNRLPRPLSMYRKGPPRKRPGRLSTRYFTASRPSAYLVAMPKNAAVSIHKRAPGPPAATAVATPTMLPVPTVAAREVHSAEKAETSPLSPFSPRRTQAAALLRNRT